MMSPFAEPAKEKVALLRGGHTHAPGKRRWPLLDVAGFLD
jgi:hypothetical protein